MNILRLLFENLYRGTMTDRFPKQHSPAGKFRGLVENDESRCVGCAQCAYVCPSGAIEVRREGETYNWSYDPGKCTFCARCIDRCKPNTLAMQTTRPPVYAVSGELKTILIMTRKRPLPKPATPKEEAQAEV